MSAAPEPEPSHEHGSVPGWPPLGRLLVDGGLISEAQLEQALAEQRHDGSRLGDIVLAKGWISRLGLASIVAHQHGLELSATTGPEAEAAGAGSRTEAWKPLGQLLLEKGLITQMQLKQTIAEQRATGRRLGEILVSRNWLTAIVLMRLLDEQQGLGLIEQPVDVRLSALEETSEQYEVEQQHERHWAVVHTSPTYFDATDVAFDLLDTNPTEALRIVRVHGEERERVWSFDPRESRAESTLDAFGYPVTTWNASGVFPGARASTGTDPQAAAAHDR